MIIKYLGPLSVAKINGIIGAIMGFIFGVFWTFISLMVGAMASGFGPGRDEGMFAILFGVGAVIFLPLFYGIVSFVGGLIGAWLYNVIAGWVGGIEIEFEQPPAASGTPTAL